ncbi:MAG: hypothetical protein L3J37_08685 [Rhodobacteraceae bacterium]|nr:hypothetical protein [Paracoccaceae bacterium]
MRLHLPSLVVLLAFAVFGLSFLLWQKSRIAQPPHQGLETPETKATGSNASSNNLALVIYQSDISLLTTRPLLSPTRRQPVPMAVAPIIAPAAPQPIIKTPSPSPILPPDIVMIGLLGGESGPMALIRGETGAESWVQAGDEIEGWRVLVIAPKSITLQLNGKSVDIHKID